VIGEMRSGKREDEEKRGSRRRDGEGKRGREERKFNFFFFMIYHCFINNLIYYFI
jgi:hypothetical protein